MKKLVYVFALVVCGMVFTSCNEQDDPTPIETPTEVSCTEDGEVEVSSGTKTKW